MVGNGGNLRFFLSVATKLQKGFDDLGGGPYMPFHRSGGLHGPLRRSSKIRRHGRPGRWGWTGRRFLSLFDIVGLDEGTCGRRLAGLLRPQGAWGSLKASLTYMSLLLIHSNRFVQVGLPEMSCAGAGYSTGAGVVGMNLRV